MGLIGFASARSIPNHLVAEPESVVFALLDKLEFQRDGRVVRVNHTVEDGGNIMTAIYAGQQTYLVDEPSSEKAAVYVATSFEQQRADSEVLAEQTHRFGKIDNWAPDTTYEISFSRSISR